MKKVSVVVPCHNVSAYLDKCMEHLLHQTIGLDNIEIILVDDASEDNGETLKIILKYEERFPDTIIAVSLQQNLRQGGARNVGISYASGEYLMFCDADDWIALDAMECLYKRAKEYDADVVEFQMLYVNDSTDCILLMNKEGTESFFFDVDTVEKRKKFFLISHPDCSLGCMRKFYRMSMIRENYIQFAEHLICEEPSFTVPVRVYEKRHYFLDKVLYFYYMSPNSTTRGSRAGRELDNLRVWEILIEDLKQRGVLPQYYDELSYLFFTWGYRLSIQMLLQRGDYVSVKVVRRLIDSVLNFFPDIRTNPYFTGGDVDSLLLTTLDMEITEESVRTMNQILKKFMT